MSKRVIGIFMTLMLIAGSLLWSAPAAYAADGDVYIKSYDAGEESIYEGDTFDLSIELDKNSVKTFSRINLTFDTSADFQVVGQGNVVPADTNFANNNRISMLYTGGSNLNIPVTITYEYEGGGEGTTVTKLYISKAKPTSAQPQPQPSERDPNKYKPVLALEFSSIPEGKAGGTINIPLNFTNTSKYEAKNIRITPLLEGTPFFTDQLTNYQTLEKLGPEKSAGFEFRFKVDQDTQENNYKIGFKIDYTNVYGDSYDDLKNEIIYVRVINNTVPARLVVREASSNPVVIQGEESFEVSFDLWNMGTLAAENVIVDLEQNDNFFVQDSITKQYLYEMKGLHNRLITYTLKPRKELETGTYGITVSLQHKDLQTPEKYTLFVSVQGEEEEEEEEPNADLVFENIVTPQEAAHAEQPFTVSMDIVNTGSTDAKNVKVSVDSGDKILPQSLNILVVPEIAAGESYKAVFSFMPGKDCENQTYPIKTMIEYKNGEEVIKKEQYIGVLVENEKQVVLNTVPKIIISEYSSDPGMVNAGENFTLKMSFLNTNKLKAVENMKITLIVNESSEQTGSVFTPVQSSNTFYIDYLGPGETSHKEMVMYTIPDAKAKTYVVKAAFEYEYEEQGVLKTNTMEDVFGIPVVQPAKLETTEVVVSEPAFVGEPVYVTSEFYNMGKVALSNLMVKIEGDFDAKETNYFVGNFQTGYSDYYEARITPLQPGEMKGMVVYTFEDAAGTEHRIENEFTVNVMEAMPVMNPEYMEGGMGGFKEGMGMDPGMMGQKPSRFPLIPVIIGGVVVLAVVFIIILRKRKKKKEMVFDEDI